MKKNTLLLGTIVLLVFAVLAFTGCAKAVASVNGFNIKSSELDVYLGFIKTQNPDLAQAGNEETLKLLEEQVTESLVINRLLEEYALQNGLSVTDEEFNAEYDKLKALHPTEEEFFKELEDNNISIDFLSKELRVQLLRNKVFEIETADVSVSEDEIKEYYETNKDIYFKVEEQARMGHILIRFESADGEDTINIPADEELLSKSDAFEKISDIKEELANGASFEELAKEYSQDPFSAENGGDMGFIGKGQLVEEFEVAAYALEDGQISEIIETVYGFHIIKMYEYKDASYMTFDESKEDIRSYIENASKSEKWEEFLTSLKDKADIRYFNKSQPEPTQEQ